MIELLPLSVALAHETAVVETDAEISVYVEPPFKDPQRVSPAPSAALKVAVIVCDAVEVVKSEDELPVSVEISIAVMVCVAGVVSNIYSCVAVVPALPAVSRT